MAKSAAQRMREYRERKRRGEVLDVRAVLKSHEARIRALEDGVAARAARAKGTPLEGSCSGPEQSERWETERPGPHQSLQSQIDAVPNRLTPQQMQDYLRRKG